MFLHDFISKNTIMFCLLLHKKLKTESSMLCSSCPSELCDCSRKNFISVTKMLVLTQMCQGMVVPGTRGSSRKGNQTLGLRHSNPSSSFCTNILISQSFSVDTAPFQEFFTGPVQAILEDKNDLVKKTLQSGW